MLDLDVLQEPNDEGTFEVYCRFGIRLIYGYLTYTDWRLLTSRFGIQQYVIPDQREILLELLDAAYAKFRSSPASLIQAAMTFRHLESHYTMTHQVRMLEIIRAEHLHSALPHGIITAGPAPNMQFDF